MTFGRALAHITDGDRYTREGWNGKNMWIALVTDGDAAEGNIELEPFIVMKTVDDKFVPWLASQTDILASDWVMVDG